MAAVSNTVPTTGTAMAMAIVAVDDNSSASAGGDSTCVVVPNTLLLTSDNETAESSVAAGVENAMVTVSVVGVVVAPTTTSVVVGSGVAVVFDAQEITSDPVALAVDKTVPNRMMTTSPSATSITAFSLVAVAHPPKSLHVALATEAAVVDVGQTARYTPSIVSVVKLHPSIVALPVHVARHSYQTSF